jgi:hypothetical protein
VTTIEQDAGGGIDDDELTALALAADADAPLPADAVPFGPLVDGEGWYDNDGSPPVRRRRPRWVKVLIVVVIVAFLVVDAYGLCSTYGIIETA